MAKSVLPTFSSKSFIVSGLTFMEYYSVIKRNKIGSFVETWMDQESNIE